jgi:hypothetical protein
MWDIHHAQEALRACNYQIETLSNRLRNVPLPPEEEKGELEVLLGEWEIMRRAILLTVSFLESERENEIAAFLPLLQNHLTYLDDRSEWPENWEETDSFVKA